MVMMAFQTEHQNLRDAGYDLAAIDPNVWVSALYALWERVANDASFEVLRAVGESKQLNPELVLAARIASESVAVSASRITATSSTALIGLQPWEIDDTYEAWEAARVGTIVETEMLGAWSFGDFQTARRFYRVKVWRTQSDGDVRDSHQDLADDPPIPVDSVFANGLLCPGDRGGPIEEWINCRCWPEYFELA